MSMQHDLAVLKRQQPGRAKTFDEVRAEAETYECQGQYSVAAVMWNVAQSVAATPEQKAIAKDRWTACKTK